MDIFAINLIVLGKSGVGKSSFCNYLFNKPGLFEAGSGKPVTAWDKNFQSYSFDHQGHILNVFDSVGLEADNYERWEDQFNRFMQERSERPMEPETWIHGAFYVINASSARLEPVDLKLIRRIGQDDRIPLQVILTNADVAGEKVEDLTREINKECPGVSVTPVCSVSVRKRGGHSTQCFGRDEVVSLYLEQSHAFLSKRLAAMSCLNFIEAFKKIRNTVIGKIKEANLSVLNFADLDLDKEFDLPDFSDICPELRCFDDYLSSFGFNVDWNTSDEVENAITLVLDNFQSEIEGRLNQIVDGFESDSLIRKIEAALKAAKMMLTLKKTLIDIINEGFDRVDDELNHLFYKYNKQDKFFRYKPDNIITISKPTLFGFF